MVGVDVVDLAVPGVGPCAVPPCSADLEGAGGVPGAAEGLAVGVDLGAVDVELAGAAGAVEDVGEVDPGVGRCGGGGLLVVVGGAVDVGAG